MYLTRAVARPVTLDDGDNVLGGSHSSIVDLSQLVVLIEASGAGRDAAAGKLATIRPSPFGSSEIAPRPSRGARARRRTPRVRAASRSRPRRDRE